MKSLAGKSVYEGIVFGPIHVMRDRGYTVKRENITDPEAELIKVERARLQAKAELQDLYEKALEEVGEDYAAIFRAHQLLLEDGDYREAVEKNIRNYMMNAEYAVAVAGNHFSEMFAAMDDEYMQARVTDIKDVTGRMLRCLCGGSDRCVATSEPVILVADDLTPGETVALDKSKILALVTVHGSPNSHTAILARTMNLPALVCVNMDIDQLVNGTEALVDGYTGRFVINPSEELREQAVDKLEKEAEKRMLFQKLKGKENITLSGQKIDLCANIGNLSELDCALENDAGGVGLFRSEFLFLGRSSPPDEEEQYGVYKEAAQKLAGKKLVVRTLDIGADKQVDYLLLEEEANPALGYRAIRISLTRQEIFRTQLRALYRAAVYGNLSVLYPMIISTEEVETIQRISGEVKAELAAEGIPYRDVEEGIMIETPAAVMISDELAEMVDFFSIGTNDLTQYTLAIDRQNANLDTFYNPYHKGVLKMIRMVTEHAHKAGKKVGICGELGADPEMTETFVKMGVDELSVAPSSILKLRSIIRQIP